MKVLHVTTHMNIGGIGNYIFTLAKALKNKGIEIIVASSGGNLEEELKKNNIEHRHVDIDTKFEFAPKVFGAAFAISEIIKKEKIDIIHAHTRVSQVASSFASFMTGKPYLSTCHGFFKKRARGIFDTWGRKVIAISASVKVHLKTDLGVKEKRIELIYSGVDISRFGREYSDEEVRSIKLSLGLKDSPVVGTIGRLSNVKGHVFLIEAMKEILANRRDVQALIVGDGPDRDRLKTLVRDLNMEDAVFFVSSNPDTHKFLSIMDVFVFPSIKEGLGIALLEALAARRACVASNVGGIRDIIKDGFNGILVDACDTIAISDAVSKLLGDPVLRKEMGGRGRDLVAERFLLDSMVENMADLYERVKTR